MTIVLVHGNPETSAIWRPLIASLATQGVTDVVTLSPPGFGAPTEPGWDAKPTSYVRWLADELSGIDGPIDIVGHDWGTGHVFGLLVEHPNAVRSWAVDVAGLVHPDYEWHDMAQLWQTPGDGEAAIAAMISMPLADRQKMYEGLGMEPTIAGELAAALDQEMGRCVLALYRAARQPMLAEMGRRLGAIDLLPGLVIDATEDAYISSDLAPHVIKALGAQHLELKGQGHWWMMSAPDEAAVGLVRFWRTLS